MNPSTIDFEAICATVDLHALIVADLGPPDRGRKWLCPFHDDRTPSLAITPDRRHWRCWSCGAAGDAVDWMARRDGLDLAEAARRLDPLALDGRDERKGPLRVSTPTAPPAPGLETQPAWHHPEWQAAVEEIVADAEAELWSRDGRPALDWLRSRGLADDVIRRFRLGFVLRDRRSGPLVALGDDDRGEPRRIWARRGITLPWMAPGSGYAPGGEVPRRWVGCNVRRLEDDPFGPLSGPPKCMALAGSARGYLYPWADVLPTQGLRPALLVEGEIDALLGEQEAGHLAVVGTVGGSGQTPHDSALVALARCPWWLLAHDHDAAGVEAARGWKERAPDKSHRVMLPYGKDLGEFVQAGGDVLGWLSGEWERLDWPWPLRSDPRVRPGSATPNCRTDAA